MENENQTTGQKIKSFLTGLFCLLVIIAVCLLFTSCMTNRKGELTEKGVNFIAQYCKGSDSTSIKDVTKTTVDTLKIYFPVQGPIQYLENPCANLCDSFGKLKPFEIKKKTNGITGTIKSIGNSIVFDCKTDSLLYIIETQKRTIDTYKKNKIVIQAPCKLEHKNKFNGFTFWWFWITVGLLILIIIIRFVKNKI